MTLGEDEVSRRELRLAVVLYGGVSLCIYMHGTTKEINRLVSASARLAAGLSLQECPSETVYRELLEWIAQRDLVRTDVSVDVIAGTSAGGINGVYLAKALARNLSQDVLRDLWLKRGDIKGLLRGWRRLPLWLRVPLLLPRLPWKAPLRGEEMALWLYEALGQMDAGGAPADLSTLMPKGSRLDLMVTMTDFYGYDRQVVIRDPKVVHDEQHRHVFRFVHDGRTERFDAADNVALAFAARATSCFPGAFDPVNPKSFCERLPGSGRIDSSFFRLYELSGADADMTYFIDGGVLDNRPFAPAIEAIREKPAEVGVKRRLLYLDPDPAPPVRRAPGECPATVATVLGAISGLPRKQPILDSLLEIERLNERVREVRDVIEASFDHVKRQVKATAAEMLAGKPDPATVSLYEQRLNLAAREQTGIGYAPYIRTKIASVLDRIAHAVCAVCDYPAESNQAMLTKTSLRAWAADRGLFADALPPSEAQVDFLRGLDVDYTLRRAHFTLAGVNWLYEGASESAGLDAEERATKKTGRLGASERMEFDAVKSRLWKAIADFEDALAGAVAQLEAQITACFPEPEMTQYLWEFGLDSAAWARQKREELDRFAGALAEGLRPSLQAIASNLYGDLLDLTVGWNEHRRVDLLVRYVGFSLWDAQLYPLESGIGAGERDAIEVMRMSPLDSQLLSWPDPGPKVKGTAYGHFGAFFKREWRENDYLAGRLDGADRMIALLLGDVPERREWSRKIFLAILEEEEPVLRTAGGLIAELRNRAEALREPPRSAVNGAARCSCGFEKITF